MHLQNLVIFFPFILKLLSGNKIVNVVHSQTRLIPNSFNISAQVISSIFFSAGNIMKLTQRCQRPLTGITIGTTSASLENQLQHSMEEPNDYRNYKNLSPKRKPRIKIKSKRTTTYVCPL